VLYWNPDKAVAPFGSIGEKGVLKNIVFVTDGNKSVYIGSDTNHLRNHMVDKNLGVILNATCMSIDAFNGDTPSSSNVTIGVASVNMGRMYDLTLIHTGACCINAGIISGVNVIVEDYSETNQTYSNDYFIGHYTTGYIEDVTVVAENGQSNVFLGVTYGGSGTFKNINYLNKLNEKLVF